MRKIKAFHLCGSDDFDTSFLAGSGIQARAVGRRLYRRPNDKDQKYPLNINRK